MRSANTSFLQLFGCATVVYVCAKYSIVIVISYCYLLHCSLFYIHLCNSYKPNAVDRFTMTGLVYISNIATL